MAGSEIIISDCIFSRVTSSGANNDGGALHVSEVSYFAVIRCSFRNCSTDNGGAGGAIYISQVRPDLNAVQSIRTNNNESDINPSHPFMINPKREGVIIIAS